MNNLVGTPTLARTTPMASTTRLARWLTSHTVVNRLLLLTLDRNPWCVDDDGTVSCEGLVVGQLPTPVSDLGGAFPRNIRAELMCLLPAHKMSRQSTTSSKSEMASTPNLFATVWPVVDSTRNWTQWSGPPRLRVMRTRVDNDDEHLLRLVVSEMQCPRPRGHEITTRDRFSVVFLLSFETEHFTARATDAYFSRAAHIRSSNAHALAQGPDRSR